MDFNGYRIEPGANLKYARLAGLASSDIQQMNLAGANLYMADLSRAYLYWADLAGADLRCANLRGADLLLAEAEGANFSEADLSGATLNCAVLVGADFRGACLSGADLTTSNLEGANLTGAIVLGADFRGANLKDVVFDEVDRTHARFDPNYYPRWSGGIINSDPKKSPTPSPELRGSAEEVLCVACRRNPIYRDAQCQGCYVDGLEDAGRTDHRSRREILEWRHEQERQLYGDDD